MIELLIIGLLAGYLAGFLGIGGGFVVVPALTYLFLQDPATAPWAIHMAVGTSLATMLVTSLSSIIAHHRKKAIRWPLVAGLAPGLLLGAVLGAVLADFLQPEALVRVVGVFAVLAGAQLIFGRKPAGEKPLPGQPVLSLVGTVIGGISSLIGIGGGALTGPWQLWHGIRAQNAVATSAACGYPIAIAGSISFLLLGLGGDLPEGAVGYVHLPAFAGIAVASVVAAPLGAATVHRLAPNTVRRVFGVFLVLVGIRMLVGF
ncbi:MAG: sulfite exporter TauE/SafE family protein [Lysobacterales bacterium]